jgi:hypothetical protein
LVLKNNIGKSSKKALGLLPLLQISYVIPPHSIRCTGYKEHFVRRKSRVTYKQFAVLINKTMIPSYESVLRNVKATDCTQTAFSEKENISAITVSCPCSEKDMVLRATVTINTEMYYFLYHSVLSFEYFNA